MTGGSGVKGQGGQGSRGMRVNVNECMNEFGELQRDTQFEQFGQSKGQSVPRRGQGRGRD